MENVTATLGADQMADAADATMVDATMTDATMAEHEYKLFCVVVNEDEAFPVMIRPNETVGDLKKAIKAENQNAFETYDAKDLKLFQVDVAVGEKSKVSEQIAALELLVIEDNEPRIGAERILLNRSAEENDSHSRTTS